MKLKHLRVGIVHSLIGKNDGVSIVIDQTVNAMVDMMDIELGNIFFLAAHSSPRFNAETNDIFWHKNEIHKRIIREFQQDPSEGLDAAIHEKALEAKAVIKEFVERNEIDLIIAHNTSHPYNFITAVGLGYYIEELRDQGIIWPKLMVWWHDSYFERPIFERPNAIVQKYLKYLPGNFVDGLAFINHGQIELAKRMYKKQNLPNLEAFFEHRASVVPNTSDVPWDWQKLDWDKVDRIYPPQDNYNDSFFKDIGLLDALEEKDLTLDDACILLQHTRVVPRKRIEVALDLAFKLEERFVLENQRKSVVVLVSGHSGDEQEAYKESLQEYYHKRIAEHPKSDVLLIFGEGSILSHRDIIVDKKYYKFGEIPSIIAAQGGIGTYFSEIEGFGNNLLEMISYGLPAVINKYQVYTEEIEHLGFELPASEKCVLTDDLVNEAYHLLTDIARRNWVVHHNLQVLYHKLDHSIIADKLTPLITNMFTRIFINSVNAKEMCDCGKNSN